MRCEGLWCVCLSFWAVVGVVGWSVFLLCFFVRFVGFFFVCVGRFWFARVLVLAPSPLRSEVGKKRPPFRFLVCSLCLQRLLCVCSPLSVAHFF